MAAYSRAAIRVGQRAEFGTPVRGAPPAFGKSWTAPTERSHISSTRPNGRIRPRRPVFEGPGVQTVLGQEKSNSGHAWHGYDCCDQDSVLGRKDSSLVSVRHYECVLSGWHGSHHHGCE